MEPGPIEHKLRAEICRSEHRIKIIAEPQSGTLKVKPYRAEPYRSEPYRLESYNAEPEKGQNRPLQNRTILKIELYSRTELGSGAL